MYTVIQEVIINKEHNVRGTEDIVSLQYRAATDLDSILRKYNIKTGKVCPEKDCPLTPSCPDCERSIIDCNE